MERGLEQHAFAAAVVRGLRRARMIQREIERRRKRCETRKPVARRRGEFRAVLTEGFALPQGSGSLGRDRLLDNESEQPARGVNFSRPRFGHDGAMSMGSETPQ